MSTPTWSDSVDSIFTSTWANRKTVATQQAFEKTPFIFWLREKGRISNEAWGTRIEIPLEYGSNDTLRWIAKGDTVPITDSELLTMAYDTYKNAAVSIVRWLADDQKNRGKNQIINLVDTKLGAAERALWEEFEKVLFADGTGSNEPNGLQNIVPDDPTTGTIHGINRATYSWFRSQQKTATGAFSVYGLQDMRTCLNDISIYAQSELKDIALVTTQQIFEWYEDECMELKSLQNTMMADAGFTTLAFKGKTVMWVPSCPTGNMYFLNSNYLKLNCDPDYWMEMTGWKEIPNQAFDKVAQIVCSLQMTCSRPIVQKVMTGMTVA
jgi:hypothetical protein